MPSRALHPQDARGTQIMKQKTVIRPWQKKHGVPWIPGHRLGDLTDQKTEDLKERDVPGHTANESQSEPKAD